MAKTYYVTTPLYYVNAAPHIGHSYTSIAADCLIRFHRSRGDDVFLLTGTDEHGQKIAQAAAAAGKPPQAFVDEMMTHFKSLWTTLNVSYDDFIRTTEPRHVKVVQAALTKLHDDGKLTKATYQGWYCTPDETFWTDAELITQTGTSPPCPTCQRPLESVTEEGWHLPMRAAQPWLTEFVKTHPNFVRPATRYNEITSLLSSPLPESLCLTRPKTRVPWGIPVPFSADHVTYVWFDALLNYVSAPGYLTDAKRFAGLWPADVQFIGKDILRHHAIYWPIILHMLGLPDAQMPQMIFAHGWWKIGEQKMSKSLGNIVDPSVVLGQVLKGQPYAADVYRYFLLRDVPFGQDGNFSEDALLSRLNADLANDLGNLVNRACAMLERYNQGTIPAPAAIGCAVEDEPLRKAAVGLPAAVEQAMERIEFSTALEAIMRVVTQTNQYIETAAPWKLAKQPDAAPRLQGVLHVLAEVLRIVAITLDPFMPSVSAAMWQQLGFGKAPRRLRDAAQWDQVPPGQSIGPHPVLFPKADASSP